MSLSSSLVESVNRGNRCFASRALAVVSALSLAACAVPYVPYAGSDASKLRLTLVNGAGFSSAASNIRPARGGTCGDPVRYPQLRPYVGPSQMNPDNPWLYPRADMVDSPDPRQSDIVELRLAPGRYAIGFIANMGLSHCGVGGGMELQPGKDYRIDFRFDTHGRRCVISLSRRDDVWKTQPFLPGDLCHGG